MLLRRRGEGRLEAAAAALGLGVRKERLTIPYVRGGDGKRKANFLDGKSEIVCIPILADGRGTILIEKYRIRRWSWNTYYSPWGAENYFIREARAKAFFLIKYGRCH